MPDTRKVKKIFHSKLLSNKSKEDPSTDGRTSNRTSATWR